MPQLTIMLDLPAEVGISRKKDQKELDRMELESLEFHKKVAAGYREMAERFPERIKRIDATLPIEEIYGIIKGSVEGLLSSK